MIKTIILFGGKTIGHVIPGISTAKAIKKKNPFTRIIYITSTKQQTLSFIKLREIDKFYYIDYKNSKSIKEIKHIYNFVKDIYMLYQPNLIISFGSILGTIGLLLAKQNNIISILHEQNKVMGLGNKIGCYLTKNIFINYNFEKISKNYNIKKVGLPTLLDFEKLELSKNKKKLVIVSGSNGALFMNKLAFDFSKTEFAKNYEITVITGEKYYNNTLNLMHEIPNVHIVSFIEKLYLYLKDANIVITRGGATTLQELKKLAIKSLIIPSPNVTNNHQYKNALEHLDHSVVLEEKDYTINKLIELIKELEKKDIVDYNTNTSTLFIEAINEIYTIY